MSTVQTKLRTKQYQLTDDLMMYSLPFELRGGHVGKLFPHPDEPEEIINIKRGILSMLQVEVSSSDGKRFIEEVNHEFNLCIIINCILIDHAIGN